MRRYFFDVVGAQRSEYDYCGREMPTPEKAFGLAELIAIDLSMEEEDRWAGWSVNVRSAEGHEIISIPVQSSSLVVV